MKSILGIGNALTDILAVLPDDTLLKTYHLPKGSMQHVEGEKTMVHRDGRLILWVSNDWGNPEGFLSFVVTNLTNLLNAEEVEAGGTCPESCTNAVTESPISRAQNGGRLLRPTAGHSRSPRRRSLASRWAG